MRRRFVVPLLLVSVLALTSAARTGATNSPTRRDVDVPRSHARAAGRTVWDSVYTLEQATRGQTSYNQSCSRCHQTSLAGADETPALTGGTFLGNWSGQNLSVLHERIRTTMPSDNKGIYGRQLVADVMAYLLKMNGFPAGAAELPKEAEGLAEIRLEATRP